jgi:hypothetical protein
MNEETQTQAAYPIRYEITRPEKQSRLTNFPLGIGLLVRYILLIPHLFILYFFALVAYVVYFIATFVILFTGRYPEDMYKLIGYYVRWSSNVSAYLFSLFDKYPPFSGDQQDGYPLTFSSVRPEQSSRLLNFPIVGLVIRTILLLPHWVIVYCLLIAAFIAVFIAKFAILFTGSFPAGMHGFVVGAMRWSTRLTAYTFGLTDKYPPFSLS